LYQNLKIKILHTPTHLSYRGDFFILTKTKNKPKKQKTMEIIVDGFGFSVVENRKKLASIQLVQNYMTLSFTEEVDEENKNLIRLLCENKKNEVYRIIASSTKKGYDLCFLYLNGNYQKVAELNYGQLLVLNEFLVYTTEIEQYANENILENFTVCPC